MNEKEEQKGEKIERAIEVENEDGESKRDR